MKSPITRGLRIAGSALLAAATLAGAARAEFYINEIFFNAGGDGSDLIDQYIELRGPANAPLDNYYLLFLENELPGSTTDNRAGTIERIFDLNTRTLGSNGFLTLRQKGSRYTVAPGTTDLVNEGTGGGFGNGPGSSTIGASTNGDLDLEAGGFTAMLIRNDSGVAPTLGLDLDIDVDNDDNPLTLKDGLDYPGQGQPGWTILDSIGIFAEPDETETGRVYGMVNYARFDALIPPEFVPQIEPGTEFQKINFEIEYVGRWGNSTGHDLDDWHVSNFTDNPRSGSMGVTAPGGPDWRQSCITGPMCHPVNDNNPNTPAPQPPNGSESSLAVPYGTKLSDTLGSPNFMFGDYNKDGVVDAADYTMWRNTLGTAGSETAHPAADTNHDFKVDAVDYNIWKANYGQPNLVAPGAGGLAGGGSFAVPEPTSVVLLAMALVGCLDRRRAR